jgi:hypothetical protein
MALQFGWDFGDGCVSPDATVAHTFTIPGTYNVFVPGVDPYGLADWAFIQIVVLPPSNQLAMFLGALEEGEFLILSSRQKIYYYVQFAQLGIFGFRAEAACNSYSSPEDALTVDDYKRMVVLGWQRATDPPFEAPEDCGTPGGSPNFFLDTSAPVDHMALATIAVDSLRSVYKIGHPEELQYKAFNCEGPSIRFLTLGIRREQEEEVE